MSMKNEIHLVLIAGLQSRKLQIEKICDCFAIKKISVLGKALAECDFSCMRQEGIVEYREFSVENLNRILKNTVGMDTLIVREEVDLTCFALEKMINCAYSEEHIAAVMPMMPGFSLIECGFQNVLDEKERVRFLEAVKMQQKRLACITESIPYVGDGCFYIPLEAFKNCSYFDADYSVFSNALIDWCLNADLLGYRCVLCGDAYTDSEIENYRTTAVSDEIQRLKDTHTWDYSRAQQFNWSAVAQKIKDQVFLRKILCNDRKNILYVLHRDYAEDAADHIGGTQFHVKDLVREVRKVYNVVVLARDWGCVRLSAYNSEEQVIIKIPISDSAPYPRIFHEELAQLMRGIYQSLPFDLVHIHHTYQLSFDVFTETKRAGIPMVCTLHDYYYLCPAMKMLDEKNCCCIGRVNEKQCEECWKVRSQDYHIPDTVHFLKQWKKASREALGMCTVLFVPSNSSKKVISLYYPELSDKIKVIPHGIDMMPISRISFESMIQSDDVAGNIDVMPDEKNGQLIGWGILQGVDAEQCNVVLQIMLEDGEIVYLHTQKTPRDDIANLYGSQQRMSGFSVSLPRTLLFQNLKVCLCITYQDRLYRRNIFQPIATVSTIKTSEFNVAFVGGMSVEKGSQIALEMIRKGPSDIGWFMIGGCGDRELKYFSKPNFTDLGWYQREELRELLQTAKIDLICILPIVSETFCYVLSEAMMCGIPVLVTDIGALGERVRSDGSGWIVPTENAAQHALKKIEILRKHPKEIKAVQERLSLMTHRSVLNMDQDYLKYYQELKIDLRERNGFNYEKLIQIGNGKSYQLKNELQLAVQQINRIENSRTYKIVRAFEQSNIPGKKQMMSLAYWMARKLKMNV